MVIEYLRHIQENIMMYTQQRTVITSRNKQVVHLMKVSHKCNKAAMVIRSATGHFTTAHTPQIGLWREIWWAKEVELPHLLKDQGRFNSVWLDPFIHINSYSDGSLQRYDSVQWDLKTFILKKTAIQLSIYIRYVFSVNSMYRLHQTKPQRVRWKHWT